jgi:hypothetical protein
MVLSGPYRQAKAGRDLLVGQALGYKGCYFQFAIGQRASSGFERGPAG